MPVYLSDIRHVDHMTLDYNISTRRVVGKRQCDHAFSS